jgi:hypothetical protein
MESFRAVSHEALQVTWRHYRSLLFKMGEQLAPYLRELRDRLSKLTIGYSFITDPTNRLADAYLELVGKACLPSPSELLVGSADSPPIWDGKKVYNYLQTHNACLRSIMVLMHIMGG